MGKYRFKISVSQICLCILFSIAFFCIYVGGELQQDVYLAKEDKNNFAYKSQYGICASVKDEADALDSFRYDKGNLKINNIFCYRKSDSNMCSCSVYVNTNESLNYPITSGEMTDSREDNTVVLGYRLKEMTQQRKGIDYITLEGDEYRVIGYIGSKYSQILDYETLFFYDRIGEGLRSRIRKVQKDGLDIMIESNKEDTSNIADTLIYKNTMVNQDNLVEGYTETNLDERVFGMGYFILAVIFCFVNTILVSEVWFMERYQEIVIKFTFGFTKRRIYRYLFRELFCTSSLACIVSYCVCKIYLCLTSVNILREFNKKSIAFDILMLFLCSIVTGIIALIYPIRKISHNSISELRKRGGN